MREPTSTAIYTARGGAGASTIACLLAGHMSAHANITIIDFDHDQHAIHGIPEPHDQPTLHDLFKGLHAADAVLACETKMPTGTVRLVRAGDLNHDDVIGEVKTRWSAVSTAYWSDLVLDLGTITDPTDVRWWLAEQATTSVLVLRPDYLSLRKAVAHAIRADKIVLVTDDLHTLTPTDVEAVLGRPVVSTIHLSSEVAKAFDAGILGSRSRQPRWSELPLLPLLPPVMQP